jgi:uncharacterized membrane protein YagU involved in acid resistance
MVIGSNTEKNSTPPKSGSRDQKNNPNFNLQQFVFASDFSDETKPFQNGRIFPNV